MARPQTWPVQTNTGIEWRPVQRTSAREQSPRTVTAETGALDREHQTEATEDALRQIENVAWKDLRRAGCPHRDYDELMWGPAVQQLESRVKQQQLAARVKKEPQPVADVRALRAIWSLYWCRQVREFIEDADAAGAASAMFQAMLSSGVATDSDLFRRPRVNAAIKTNRKKRRAMETRADKARKHAASLRFENPEREIPAAVAAPLGVSPKTARRYLKPTKPPR